MRPLRRSLSLRVGSSLGVTMLAVAVLVACAVSEADAHEAHLVALPPVAGVFDYQLGGEAKVVVDDGEDAPIDVVVRDASAQPLEGAYSICYVNGFQTQPQHADVWLARTHALLKDPDGEPRVDPQWDDEYILDPSTPLQRTMILDVIGPQIDRCAREGFDAVEIDNLDSWTRFDQIDKSGARELAAEYVARVHAYGLAIAQKNAVEIAPQARDELGFDFAIAEDCAIWDECGGYTDVYGDHVLQVEYPHALETAGMTFGDACEASGRAPLMILRDLELVPPGGRGYRYDAC